jgi:TolB-like protein/DNA-binding winged helix-turn-helix (wHTH) protein
MADDEISFGPFRLDLRGRRLSRHDKVVPLGGRALDLLCVLASARGELVTKDRLMAEVWPGLAVEENNLYVHISTIRKALETEADAKPYLVTVPGRGYRFISTPAAANVGLIGAGEGLPLVDMPSIVVLPFQSMTSDPTQDYFADGMAEEIITALSRFRHLFVISHNTSLTYKGGRADARQVARELGVRYVLEGSVRRTANRIRITGKLIDAANGAHLWADRFEAVPDDVFDLQDAMVAMVVGAIAPKLEAAEIGRVKRKPTDRLDAYECYLRGASIASSTARDANDEALRWLYRAIDLDSDFALAYAKAAQCYGFRKVNGWMSGRPEELGEATRVSRRAVNLGGDDAVALSYGGFVLAYVAGELDDGAAFIDRALSLNPNWAYAWAASGWMKLCFGQPETAIEHTATAIRLSPFDPLMFAWHSFTALAQICAGRYDEAVAWSAESLRRQPDYPASLRVAAASNALGGHLDEAKPFMERLRQLDPGLCAANLQHILPPFRRAEDRQVIVEGLLKAGLPN